jgi:hypothetical protein
MLKYNILYVYFLPKIGSGNTYSTLVQIEHKKCSKVRDFIRRISCGGELPGDSEHEREPPGEETKRPGGKERRKRKITRHCLAGGRQASGQHMIPFGFIFIYLKRGVGVGQKRG